MPPGGAAGAESSERAGSLVKRRAEAFVPPWKSLPPTLQHLTRDQQSWASDSVKRVPQECDFRKGARLELETSGSSRHGGVGVGHRWLSGEGARAAGLPPPCSVVVPAEWGKYRGSVIESGLVFEDKNGTLRLIAAASVYAGRHSQWSAACDRGNPAEMTALATRLVMSLDALCAIDSIC